MEPCFGANLEHRAGLRDWEAVKAKHLDVLVGVLIVRKFSSPISMLPKVNKTCHASQSLQSGLVTVLFLLCHYYRVGGVLLSDCRRTCTMVLSALTAP